MVMFDIKLKEDPAILDYKSKDTIQTDIQVASFEPDITSLVNFLGGKQEFMRNKTQILIQQNYEQIKQRMLNSVTGAIGDALASNPLKAKQQAVIDAKLSGYGFLAGFV